ncbi:mynd finger family protein [Moniliophthora roreri MCA 2997]|uniref:Mynd finger family protein n=2 Tax=Moniliophthora roreri TaxID=221103 RepID=V2WXH1_MONRO|nr:mynd finger family protein [Moniliophthora roreri MCA 2997]
MQGPTDYQLFKSFIRQQFTSHEGAMARLRRNNKLPVAFDVSRPPVQVWNALGSIAYLTDKMHNGGSKARKDTMASVKKNWSSGANIGLWVTFLIENVALADESKGPFTPEGVDLLDKVLRVLSLLLLYPDAVKAETEDVDVEARILRRASPNLPLLSTNVWLRVLELSHATWHTWSAVVALIMYDGSHFEAFADHMTQVNSSGKLDVTRIYICHLLLVTQHFGDMGEQRFIGLQLFMSLVYISSFKGPLYSPFLLNGGIPALFNLLKMFITRPKLLQRTPNDSSDFHCAALLLIEGASLLGGFLATPMWISQALDLGLLILMFKAKRFFAYDKIRESKEKDCGRKLGDIFSEMLNTIKVFIVYPSIRTRFLKSMKHIIDSGLEENLQPRPEPFWSSWETCKLRANYCKVFFNHSMVRMCGYEGCSSKGYPAGEEGQKIRYLKCSACSSVSYCSRECGKKDWPNHRKRCSRNRQLMKKGTKPPSFMDTEFFTVLVRVYVFAHASQMTVFDPLGPQLPLDRIKRQSVVIYFDDPTGEVLSPDHFKILDPESLQKEKRMYPRVFSAWKRIASNAKDGEVIVIGFFPAVKDDDSAAIPIIRVFPRDRPRLDYRELRRRRAERNGEKLDDDENEGSDSDEESDSDGAERLEEDIGEEEGRFTTSGLECVE